MTIAEIRTFIQTDILNDDSIEIEPEQDLLLSRMLDSLSVIRLVEHIEEETSLRIPAEDVTLEHFGSLRAIESYLQSLAD